MKKFLFILFCLCMVISCKKSPAGLKPNASVFRFNAQKCFCCWGWYVKKDTDTFKIDVLPAGVQLSTDIQQPIPVYIETGAIKYNCKPVEYEYYEVLKLKLNP